MTGDRIDCHDLGMELEKLAKALAEAGMTLSEYNELTDESITDEEVQLLRKHAIPRPPKVCTARLTQPAELTTRHKAIINHAALGLTAPQIAEEMGMYIGYVKKLLASPLFKQKIASAQNRIFENNGKAMMGILKNKAFAAIEFILEDDNEKSSVKLEAAKYVIDHHIGKAKQLHEMDTSLLSDIITKLDSEKHKSPERAVEEIRATPDEPDYVAKDVDKSLADKASATALKVLEKSDDDMDTLVDNIVSGDFVVGRRGL